MKLNQAIFWLTLLNPVISIIVTVLVRIDRYLKEGRNVTPNYKPAFYCFESNQRTLPGKQALKRVYTSSGSELAVMAGEALVS